MGLRPRKTKEADTSVMRSVTYLFLTAIAVAAALGPVAGGQQNQLTSKEVSDGWILLYDGETPFGWAPRGDAKWQVQDGLLAPVPGSGKGVLSTTTEFPNYRLAVEFWVDDTANSGVFLRCPPEGEITQSNAYEVNIYDKHEKWPTGSINDVARVGSQQKTAGKWNTLDISADGDHLVVLLNGKAAVDVRDRKYTRGTVGLQYNGEGQVKFRNVKLQPLGLKSIFNGKDLTGWKEIPGRKSVYSVTPEGYLNVKNGNGDLQTEGMYGDFIFQLDIISNGMHLNSGVFFRATPGQFWSGYESQIRNQWMGEDRTKPVDYGTGGIYNRQPARRVVSSDREWFTKTIVAHGRHMAVWVNGIQVSDFTDAREPSDNPRQGYRAKPGVLSLQGHDPTTDLSFRSLRIAEMPSRS
jgi:3-keto-disaccharide hydrolase